MINHKQFDNGYKYIEIRNDSAEAKIALQGAHLFHYKVKDRPPLLWVSEKAYFEEGKAIRGGVPVCFPWFGKNRENTALPQHGFARTALWKVILEEEIDACQSHIRLQLKPNADTLELWPCLFDLTLDVTVGEVLSIALSVTNTDSKAFEITAALHTYFSVSDINTVRITGLDASRYYNALDDSCYEQNGDILIEGEVDRVYDHPSDPITLVDGESRVQLKQEGSHSLVIWNPWSEKSAQMADMTLEGYRSMVCLETANAREDTRVLKPDQTHILKAFISQEIEK